MDRVGLIVELTGYTQAMSNLRDFKKLADQLNTNKVQLKIDTAGVDRELAKINRKIADLRQDRKNAVRMNVNTAELDKKLDEAIRKKNELTQQKAEMRINANVNTEALRLANEELRQMQENAARVADVISGIGNIASSVFGGLGNFSAGIGDAFAGMASVFDTDVMNTVKRTLTYTATRYVTGNLGGIISRYDTMNTFTQYMELAGVTAEKAAESLNRVDLSIRGIPIGLDEAATRLRRYQMYLGDIERATDLTIGLQRALIAGGSSEQMQTTAYTQIDRLLATGKLGQSRQWISLFNGLGVSLKFLKEELALDPTADMKTIASDLAAGRIAADDFLRAIERLAYNDELGKAIEIYKSTISAWMSNIRNAIKRGGQGVLEALNEVMTQSLGYGVTGVLKNVRDEIDSTAKAMSNFVRDNPQNIERLSGIFQNMFGLAQGASFGDFVTKFIDRLEQLADIIRTIVDALPDGFLSDFASFAMVLAGPLAKIFSVVASGAGVMLGVFDRFRDFDFTDLIEKIITQVERLARVVSGLLGLIPDGLLGDLMAFGLVWGKPLSKVIGGLTSALSGLFNTMRGVTYGQGGTLLSDIILLSKSGHWAAAVPGLLGFAGALSAVGFALTSYFNSKTKQGMDVLKDISGIDFDEILGNAEKTTQGIRDALSGFDQEIEKIDVQAGIIDEIADKILKTNETLKTNSNESLIAEQKRNFEELQDLANIEIKYDADTGLILDEDMAIQQLSGDYLNLAKAKQEAEALTGIRGNALTNMIEAQANASVLQDQLRDAQGQLGKLERWFRAHPGRAQYDIDGSQQPTNEYIGDMPEEYAEDFDKLSLAVTTTRNNVKDLEDQVYEANVAAEQAADYYDRLGIELGKVNYEIAKMEREGISVIDKLGNEVDFAQADENLKDILASYKAFADGARESIDEVINGFSAMEAAATVTAETIRNNLQTQLDYLTNLNTNMEVLAKFVVDNLGTERGEAASGFLQDVMLDPAAYAGELQGLREAIESGDLYALDGIFGTSNQIEAKKEEWKDLVAVTQTLLAEGYEGLIAMLNNPDLTIDEGLLRRILGDDYETVMAEVQSFKEEYTTDVAEMDESTQELLGSMGELKAEAHMVAAEIDAAGKASENASPKAEGMSTSAGKLADQLGIAAGEARALLDNLNALPADKTINVDYRVSYTAFGKVNTNGPVPMDFATGGMIPQYFDNGKWVNFVPRGTDTVPAMLTPGEFVIRKSAAQMWGKPLLEAINGMDVSGAFKAIWSRASFNGGTVNNYRDNHAQVIQNFYGDTGQGYSQKFAMRAIGGL